MVSNSVSQFKSFIADAKLGLRTIFIGENACKGYRGGLGIGEGVFRCDAGLTLRNERKDRKLGKRACD